MKSTKTVIAILTIILAPLAFLQSCAVSIGDAINETETDSPAVGVFASFIFLLAGIAGLATKKYRTGNIITGVLFLLTALSVFGTYDQIVENFPDLIAYGWLSLIAAIVYFIPSKEKAETEKSAPSVENETGTTVCAARKRHLEPAGIRRTESRFAEQRRINDEKLAQNHIPAAVAGRMRYRRTVAAR